MSDNIVIACLRADVCLPAPRYKKVSKDLYHRSAILVEDNIEVLLSSTVTDPSHPYIHEDFSLEKGVIQTPNHCDIVRMTPRAAGYDIWTSEHPHLLFQTRQPYVIPTDLTACLMTKTTKPVYCLIIGRSSVTTNYIHPYMYALEHRTPFELPIVISPTYKSVIQSNQTIAQVVIFQDYTDKISVEQFLTQYNDKESVDFYFEGNLIRTKKDIKIKSGKNAIDLNLRLKDEVINQKVAFIICPAKIKTYIDPKTNYLTKYGLIDSDYKKDIYVLILNRSDNEYIIPKDTPIAQIVIIKPLLDDTNCLSKLRVDGFGSTEDNVCELEIPRKLLPKNSINSLFYSSNPYQTEDGKINLLEEAAPWLMRKPSVKKCTVDEFIKSTNLYTNTFPKFFTPGDKETSDLFSNFVLKDENDRIILQDP